MDKPTRQQLTFLPSLPNLYLAVCEVTDHQAKIFPEELATQPRAVTKRLNEFSTGRFLVHTLQRHVGNQPSPVLSRADRSPIWPPNSRGSISHSNRYAAAALTIDPAFDSIGVDIEPPGNTAAELRERLLTPQELISLGGLHASIDQPETLFFSAKEAVYKAIHPLAGMMIEFQEVEIRIDPGSNTFSATYLPATNDSTAANLRLNSGTGYYFDIAGQILTLFVLHAS